MDLIYYRETGCTISFVKTRFVLAMNFANEREHLFFHIRKTCSKHTFLAPVLYLIF